MSSDDAWTEWCRLFLDGVAEQARENERKVQAILPLYERVKVDIVDVTHSQHGVRAVDLIFRQPVFGSAQFVAWSEIPMPSAQRFVALPHLLRAEPRKFASEAVVADLAALHGRQPWSVGGFVCSVALKRSSPGVFFR